MEISVASVPHFGSSLVEGPSSAAFTSAFYLHPSRRSCTGRRGVVVRRMGSSSSWRRELETRNLFARNFQFRSNVKAKAGEVESHEPSSRVAMSDRESRTTSSEQADAGLHEFHGIGDSHTPVAICQTRTLGGSLSLEDATMRLQAALNSLERDPPPFSNGVIRIQVPLPPDVKALQWLQSQELSTQLLPRSYFSPRSPRGDGSGDAAFNALDTNGIRGVAGVGAAVLFNGQKPFSYKDWKTIRRFMSTESPLVRAYGCLRFNPDAAPSPEWQEFGSFYFLIPQVEFCECESCSLLAVTLVWDQNIGWDLKRALGKANAALYQVSFKLIAETSRLPQSVVSKEHVPDRESWHRAVNTTLAVLKSNPVKGKREGAVQYSQQKKWNSALESLNLSKVVMARRTKFEVEDTVEPLTLLRTLQERDPSAYQFCIQVPDGTAFVGSTPERLFVRNGLLVASEAVAATRSRGATREEDLKTSINLLLSEKDHNEFEIVRESIKQHLEIVCKWVSVEFQKETIKQARVQHLYSRLNGELKEESGEYHLLSLLHPTPAVCGQPQEPARAYIASSEEFDRGMYAGPVGWIGGEGAEFCVGIRSSLVKPHGLSVNCPRNLEGQSTTVASFNGNGSAVSQSLVVSQKGTCVYLYAGVGVVIGTKPELEWEELELKISQFETLFKPAAPLEQEKNINSVWAKLIVEECCRLGVTYFCIAPGSRSSPLTAAAATNPQATCITCIDERSLAFHALGYGRGANKPAAIITSSGTAVSNLLPAVVEACQDFVPMLLLTADRPSEMQDSGANQTIDQEKHFGGFVRHHVNLPPPTDKVSVRFVLTTIDSAVFHATTEPVGPVHINCQFREPLAGTQEPWNPSCLKGLERWVSGASPFTKYASTKAGLLSGGCSSLNAELIGVADIIKVAKRGLIVVGGLHMASETWAVALLALQMGWPVVPDVVSGLRFGKAAYTGDLTEKNLSVIHNFDQILLSSMLHESVAPDVVLQIGGRLTSKRLSQFLEICLPRAYILVEEHNFRQDPSHILTHRIQSSAVEFSLLMRGVLPPRNASAYSQWLQELSDVCERECTSQLLHEVFLTEPEVARLVAASVPAGAGLFLGNSMAIRDVDMYANGLLTQLAKISQYENTLSVPDFVTRVAANRGASGIDGVLSTAVGFAVGSNRRVTLLLGDLSFLHDTNGLSLLKARTGQPPVTVVVVNNNGGGIFSMLPIAKTMPSDTFKTFWETPHDVGFRKLCLAHRVGHMLVSTKEELNSALQFVQRSRLSWVVEVQSSIEKNTMFHRSLASNILQEVNRAYRILSSHDSKTGARVVDFEIHRYSFALQALPTTQNKKKEHVRQGFLVQLILSNGFSGIGEIAPLPGLHTEDLRDVEEQLRLLAHALKGAPLPETLVLMNGKISNWLSNEVGIQPKVLFPSVRCGLEMAALGALASSKGKTTAELLLGHQNSNISSEVLICALLDSEGSIEDIVKSAQSLVDQGYRTLKIKVARRKDPLEDAAVLQAIRERVGPHVSLRADANRRWTYAQAVQFAGEIQSCKLQYVEEPVENSVDISKFCRETGIPVALDESIDEVVENFAEGLAKYTADGVVALVIKPSRVGGFEKSASIARWGQNHGMAAVISAAFESSVSLAAYAELAAYVNERRSEREADRERGGPPHDFTGVPSSDVAHGLGTFTWLPANGNDIITQHFKVVRTSAGVVVRASSSGPEQVQLSPPTESVKVGPCNFMSYRKRVNRGSTDYDFYVLDSASNPSDVTLKEKPTLFFLHGFLGTGRDWVPVMDALSPSFRCIAVDLIGHGNTTIDLSASAGDDWKVDAVTAALAGLITSLEAGKVVLVGYSMGGRIALYQALRHSQQVVGAVIVSASPGLPDVNSQNIRAAQDDDLADALVEKGLESFLEFWYSKPLWRSLRSRPCYQEIKRRRMDHKDHVALAKSFRFLSVGRQPSLWEDLPACNIPILCVAGKLDSKFVKIAHQMRERCHAESSTVPQHKAATPALSPGLLKNSAADDYSFTAWLARERRNKSMNLPGNSRNDDISFSHELYEDLKPYLITEKENFLATVQKTISNWSMDDSGGFSSAKPPEGTKRNDVADFVSSNSSEGNNNDGIRASPRTGSTSRMEVLVVEDSGHCVHTENPLALVRALREFVHSLGACSSGAFSN